MKKKTVVLAIDAGGTFFKSGLVSCDGEIEENTKFSCPVDSGGTKESVRDGYRRLIVWQMEKARCLGLSVMAVGVDTPGPFDYEKGESLMKHKFQALYRVPLRPWIEEAAGKLPITFIHDSTAFLLGEYWKGGLKGNSDCAGVMLGTGLGFAYMEHGVVKLNPQGGPGYSVYNRPFRDATAEEYISRRGIIRRYRQLTGDESPEIDVKNIAQMAEKGCKEARMILEETGTMLGEVMLPVLKEIRCDKLVIGGQISKAYPYFGKALENRLKGTGLQTIVPSHSPDKSHLLGCAYGIFEKNGMC